MQSVCVLDRKRQWNRSMRNAERGLRTTGYLYWSRRSECVMIVVWIVVDYGKLEGMVHVQRHRLLE